MNRQLTLITGATSGIGKATCELFAEKGFNLIISGRNLQELQYLQAILSKQVEVQILQADLALIEGRQKLIDVLHTQVPDLIINNAGFGLYGEALSYTTEEQAEIYEVNGKSVLEITLEGARALISANKKGIILNISSAAAFQNLPHMAVYAASKAFVNHFSQAFDQEVKDYGIRILTLCPGRVATDFQVRAGGHPNQQHTGFMSAAFVAKQILKQINRLQPLLIIDWKFRFLTFLSFLIPKSWIAKSVKYTLNKMISPRTLIKIKK